MKKPGHILTSIIRHRQGRALLSAASKVTCIGVVLLLSVSLFATGLMAAPSCGTRCCCGITSQVRAPHALPMKIQAPQGCCSGNAPVPCDIQGALPHELPDVLIASSHYSNLQTMSAQMGPASIESADCTSAFTVCPLIRDQHFRSPPLYLANLAILA